MSSSASKIESVITGGEAHSMAKSKKVVPFEAQQEVGIWTKRAKRTNPNKEQEQSSPIMNRAKQIQADLNPEFPSFIKLLRSSHVTNYMGIPLLFCKEHMPKQDESIVLVGEKGEEHKLKFLAKYRIIGSGWTVFSVAHKLQAGDVIILQLVNWCKFNVHIIRQDVLAIGDGALDQMNLNANSKETNREIKAKKVTAKGLKELARREKAELIQRQKVIHGFPLTGSSHSLFIGDSDKSENRTNNSHTHTHTHMENMDCFQIGGTFVDFNSFAITVKGFDLASKLSIDIRTKYYKLCLSRKLYLHQHLLATVKPKLAAEVISETVEIVDAILGSGFLTSDEEFVVWDKTLESFQLLGMEVGFLRAHLNQVKQKKQMFESERNNQNNNLKERYNVVFQEAAHVGW